MAHSGDDVCFSLNIAAEIAVEPLGPNDNVIEYKISVCSHDEEAESPKPVGFFNVWRFNIGDEEGSIYEMFDAHHAESHELYGHLFDRKTDRWKEELDAELPAGSDLIHFQWAEFPPELRRSRVVLAAAERIIQILGGGCCFATLWPWDKPHPDLEDYTADELLAYWDSQKKNQEFWAKISFTRLEGAPVFIRDLARISPSIQEIMAGDG